MKRIFDWVWNTSTNNEHEEEEDGQENAVLQPTAEDQVVQTPTPAANIPQQSPKRPRVDELDAVKVVPVNSLNRWGGKLYVARMNGQPIVSASYPCYVRSKVQYQGKLVVCLEMPKAFTQEMDHSLRKIEESLAPSRFTPPPIQYNSLFTDRLLDFASEMSARAIIESNNLYAASRIVDHSHGLPVDFEDVLPGSASVSLAIGHVVRLHDSSLRLQWVVSELRCNNIHRARAEFAMALVRKQGIHIPPLITERIIYFLLVK